MISLIRLRKNRYYINNDAKLKKEHLFMIDLEYYKICNLDGKVKVSNN